MAAFGKFLRLGQGQLMFWCQGCHCAHVIPIDGSRGWRFNGDKVSPTITPSVLNFIPEHVDCDGEKQPRRTLCHLFLTNGQLQFLSDCAHSFAGKTVPLEPIPADYGGLED